MRRLLPSLIAFALGVFVTVGAYETARLVRDTRKVLALASGSAPEADRAEASSPRPAARVPGAVDPQSSPGSSPAEARAAETRRFATDDKATAAMIAAREARRERMQRLLERREELGLTGAPPRTPREARRELIKATLAEQGRGAPPAEPPAP